VSIDYIQPAQDNFEERECATVRHGNVNIAELLLKNGLASVIYHRQDDENRAKNYDVLRAADEAAKEEGKGIHSGKPKALPRYIDASEVSRQADTAKLNAVLLIQVYSTIGYQACSYFLVWI
jgi:staphylococcal nuclease domain-containing protein 1